MDCEVCGAPAVCEAIVEGARLAVCGKCAKFGKVVSRLKEAIEEEHARTSLGKPAAVGRIHPSLPEADVVEDFAKRVKIAREKIGLSRKKFAKKIAIKESELKRIERSELRPTVKIAEKIERALGVKLVEE